MLLEVCDLEVNGISNFVCTSVSAFNPLTIKLSSEELYAKVKTFLFRIFPMPKIQENQIAIPKHLREYLDITVGQELEVLVTSAPSEEALFSIQCHLLGSFDLTFQDSKMSVVHSSELENCFRKTLENQFLSSDQIFFLQVNEPNIILKCKIETATQNGGRLTENTKIRFSCSNSTVPLTILDAPFSVFKKDFKFEDIGVGGLDTEISEIFRRAFASRRFSKLMLERFGCNHVRGLLLHGPPGTGKTLIARQLAKILNSKEPKIVNGPELFDKYVGETERKIRDLFFDAIRDEKDLGIQSPLHVIIFDEFDAICRSRGTIQNGTSVNDTAVNMLLSMIDGVNSLNNILVIGMTNRKDMIDEAILRPGRFEVHIEFSLPDEKGRLQILEIHTKQMKKNGLLSDDVNLKQLAKITLNFTGAEIESLLKSAISIALTRHQNLFEPSHQQSISEMFKVEQKDFIFALRDVKPMFGIDVGKLELILRNGMIDYGDRYRNNCQILIKLLSQLREGINTQLISILIYGEMGTGKSALGAWLAQKADFPYVKLLSAESLVGHTENGKINSIIKIFEDSYRSPSSVIMIDDIERIIELVTLGPQFSNQILQTLLVSLKRVPYNPKSKLLIIGTSSQYKFLKDLEVAQVFDEQIELPTLNQTEIWKVLSALNIETSKNQLSTISSIPIKKLLKLADREKKEEIGGLKTK